jgi:hypothetical protein
VGGKSGRFWCSPTRTASQDGDSVAATVRWAVTEKGSELKSARISGTVRSGTAGTGSAQTAGAGNTHGCGTTSQPPSARTPPHGPITMCFGHEPVTAATVPPAMAGLP